MPVTQTVVTLSDSQTAVSLVGLDTSTVYVRVRRTKASQVTNGQQVDIALGCIAYQVDNTGAKISPEKCTPLEILMTIHGGDPTYLATTLSKMSVNAIASFVSCYTQQLAVETIPDNLPLS